MAEWKDILSDEEEQVSEQELMKYLDGDLSEEEKYVIEKKMAASGFENDAVEGLQQFDDKTAVQQSVELLNKNLHKQLASRKLRKDKRKLKDSGWVLIAALIILGVCILGYVVIRIYHQQKINEAVSQTSAKNISVHRASVSS